MRSRDYHLIPPAVTFTSTLGGRREVKFSSIIPVIPLEVGVVENFALSSTWLYDDRGWDLGTAWKEVAYDDSAFSGPSPARLGFGADGEVTTITDSGSGFTYYFRKDITITRGDEYHAYNLEFIFDDGLVCYVNGAEQARRYMPAGVPNYETAANTTVDDGETYTVTIEPSAFVDGNNVIAVEVHQVNTTSTDVSFDMGLSAEIYEPYRVSGPATVNEGNVTGSYELLTTEADGTYYYTVHPTGGFVETDGSFTVTNGEGTFTLSAAPDELVEGNLLYGILFRTDSIAGTIVETISTTVNDVLSSPPVGTAEIFALSATWLYEDSGSDLGTTWREVSYNDTGWSSGQARLGFGADGEVTTITDVDAITYYFRKDVNISSGNAYDEYDLEFIYDDGLICWVNNQEVARVDIGTGALFDTVATATVGDGATHTATIPSSAFVDGENVIAVEVHQVNSTSSDVSFDMGLSARVNEPPDSYVGSGPAEIDEGTSDTYTLSTNEADATHYYTVHPSGNFAVESGSFSITSGTGNISLSALPDATAEADILVAIDFRTGSTGGTIVETISTTVIDVEPFQASGPVSQDEGTTDTYFLSTTQEDGTYYYSIHPSGEFVETDGSFTVTNGVGTFTLSAAPDGVIDADELVAIDFRQTSIAGTIVDTVSTTVVNTDVPTFLSGWDSFREGVNSYTSTVDTYVDDATPDTSRATETFFRTDNTTGGGASRQWGLLRFGELSANFNDNTQVNVTSASLDLEVTAEGQGADFHTAIISWADTDTYNSNTNITVADTGYISTSTVGAWPGDNGVTGPINIVLDSQQVQDWIRSPETNYGMLIISTVNRDGQDFASSENATSTFRPRLQIAHVEPDPESP